MAGTTSAIQMASNALVLIGHPPISSFDEPGAGARAASNLYESSYTNLLTLTRWRFAAKKVQLSRFAASPLNQYTYQFQLPDDLLYLINTLNGEDYEVYEDRLFANYMDISIDYIFRVDESRLPAYFIKAFQFSFASELAIPVTANSTRAAEYDKKYKEQVAQAFYLDASQRPSDEKLTSEYIDVRN